MKSETLKNALNAHGWVGLIISLPLFIVFWAGAVTFFHEEVALWATLPHYQIDIDAKTQGQQVDYNQLIETQIATHNIAPDARISLRFPSEHSPYARMFFRVPVVESEDGSEAAQKSQNRFKSLLIDPYSGEVFTDHSGFELSRFMYALHYNLHLPQGSYIVGVITLFFFVIIITGVVVQLKNLVKNFFLYRKDQNMRSQMNDMHNVVGVISLPYSIMYALSGVILNLLILVQIPNALVLYKGDTDAIAEDAGFYSHRAEALGTPLAMPNINNFVRSLEQQHAVDISGLNIHGYGDESAVIETRGTYLGSFNHDFRRVYEVVTDSYPEHMNLSDGNVFSRGLRILYSMHFADFAGTDMRLIYFVLAMAFCAMIVAGNVLWVVKRQKKNAYPKTLAFTRASTLGGCIGIITATAVAFLLERTLTEGIAEREHLVEYAFGLVLLACTIVGFFAKNLHRFIGFNLLLSGALLMLTVLFEWTVFGEAMRTMTANGYPTLAYVSASLALVAIILLIVGKKVLAFGSQAAS